MKFTLPLFLIGASMVSACIPPDPAYWCFMGGICGSEKGKYCKGHWCETTGDSNDCIGFDKCTEFGVEPVIANRDKFLNIQECLGGGGVTVCNDDKKEMHCPGQGKIEVRRYAALDCEFACDPPAPEMRKLQDLSELPKCAGGGVGIAGGGGSCTCVEQLDGMSEPMAFCSSVLWVSRNMVMVQREKLTLDDKGHPLTREHFDKKKLTFNCDTGLVGDPHLWTWHGEFFEWMGECDTVLFRIPNFDNKGTNLTMHVRTTIMNSWSYIDTAALQIGDEVLEFTGFGKYSLFNSDGVIATSKKPQAEPKIGGYPFYRTDIPTPGKKKRKHGHQLVKHEYDISLGGLSNITVTHTGKYLHVNVYHPHQETFGNVEGLLGNYKGKMMARDGETSLHHDIALMAEEWQVGRYGDDPVLFTKSRAPQYPATCNYPREDAKESLRNLKGGVSQEDAEMECAHLEEDTPHFYKACVADVIAANDPQMADAYLPGGH